MSKERWRDVVGYEGRYSVSDRGRVKSFCRRKPRILRSRLVEGYPTVSLCGRDYYIHRLVAVVFLGPPQKGHEVNHIDFNRTNNKLRNLEWITRSGNMCHSARAGRQGILSSSDVREIRWRISEGEFQRSIAKDFGVTQAHICNIHRRRRWSHFT